MSTAKNLLFGSILKFVGLVLQIVIIMVITPKMIETLGEAAYGFWLTVLAVAGTAGIVDLGISPAVTRFVSRALGRGDLKEADRTIATSFCIFNTLGLFVLLALCAFAAYAAMPGKNLNLVGDNPLFQQLFPVIIAAFSLQLAISFPARVITAVAKSHMRFDMIAVAMMARIVLTYSLIAHMLYFTEPGTRSMLLRLTGFSCGGFVIEYIILLYAAKKNHPTLSLNPFTAYKDVFKNIAGYSAKSIASRLGFYACYRVDALIVAEKLDSSAVTYYSIPQRLINYFFDIMGAVLGNFVPIFSQYEGRGENDQLTLRFMQVMRVSIVITTFVAASMAFYGGAFIERWVGDVLVDHEQCHNLLLILVFPVAFDLMHIPAHGVFYALNKHHIMAWIFGASGLVKLVVAWILIDQIGLPGLAWGHAIANLLPVIVIPIMVCRCIRYSPIKYFSTILLPTFAKTLAVLSCFFLIARGFLLPTYLNIGILAGIQSVLFAPIALLVLLGKDERELLDTALRNRFRLVELGERFDKIRKLLLWPIALFAFLVVTGTGADYGYSLYAKSRLKKFEAAITRDSGGVRESCRAQSYPAVAGFVDSAKPALLLIHGFGDSPDVWRKIGPALAENGYHVRAMKLPGMAEEMNQHQQASLTDWRAAVRTEVQRLREHVGAEQIVLVGHSTGGALAVDFVQSGGEAAGVVCVAPAFGVSNVRSPVLTSEQWFTVLRPLLRSTDMLVRAFPVQLNCSDESLLIDEVIPLSAFDAFFGILRHNRTQAKSFTGPVRFIVASQDEVVDNQAARAWYDAVGASDKDWHEQPKSGHVIPLDCEWQETVDLIHDFASRRNEQP